VEKNVNDVSGRCAVEEGRVTVLEGWCAGRNPPSVQRRHSSNRATRVSPQLVIDAYLPFLPCRTAVSTLPRDVLGNLACLLATRLVDVPFLLCCQGSRPTPLQALQGCGVGRSFLRPVRSEAVRQLTNPSTIILVAVSNKGLAYSTKWSFWGLNQGNDFVVLGNN